MLAGLNKGVTLNIGGSVVGSHTQRLTAVLGHHHNIRLRQPITIQVVAHMGLKQLYRLRLALVHDRFDCIGIKTPVSGSLVDLMGVKLENLSDLRGFFEVWGAIINNNVAASAIFGLRATVPPYFAENTAGYRQVVEHRVRIVLPVLHLF